MFLEMGIRLGEGKLFKVIQEAGGESITLHSYCMIFHFLQDQLEFFFSPVSLEVVTSALNSLPVCANSETSLVMWQQALTKY